MASKGKGGDQRSVSRSKTPPKREKTVPQEFNFHTSKRHPSRSKKDEQEAEARAKATKAEETFKPKINRRSGVNEEADNRRRSTTSFFDRQVAWQKEKDQKNAELRKKKEDHSLDGCTFQPNVSVHGDRPTVPGPESASLRLYHDAAIKQKRDLEAEKKAREKKEAELRRSCTFQPKINEFQRETEAGPTVVKSRFRDRSPPGSIRKAAKAPVPTDLQGATFRPRTNEVDPSMRDAIKYLSSDAFERLSNPPPKPVIYDKTPRTARRASSTSRRGATPRATREAIESRRPQSARRPRPSSRGGDTESTRGNESFLMRQEKREAVRQAKLSRMKDKLEPTFEPMLCKKSISLSAKRGGDFLERQKQEESRKAHRDEMRMRKDETMKECTFKPVISTKGQESRARSVDEMSTGDALKKQALQEALKLKKEQEELENLTFRPRIHHAPGVEGRLKILSEPETYVQRVQSDQIRQDQLVEEHQRQLEIDEMAECSFKPEIHDAPAYVKRIARSMALTKSARPAPEEPGQPAWR